MKINVDQICTISIYRKYPYNGYVFKKGEKSIWGNRKEGFYSIYYLWGDNKAYTKEDIEKSGELIIEGERCYWLPHIEFRMSNGKDHTLFFKTEKELDEYLLKKEITGLKLIEI